MLNDKMNNRMYNLGYKDGWSGKEKLSASMLEFGVHDYMNGYDQGKSDKEFCETYSDEALGIYGGFDG